MNLTWIALAAIAPFLWAIVNHIDKYFLSDKFSHAKVGITGGLMIFSTLFSIFVLPVVYLYDTSVIYSASVHQALILISVGILNALSIYLYLHALDRDEASIVVPIFQTVPVFGFVFGFMLLGEILSLWQLIGGTIILLFSMLLTLELDFEQGVKIKKTVLYIMFASSALFALGEVVFKYGAVETNFATALFWDNVGLLIFGTILLFIPSYRSSFLILLRKNKTSVISLNLTSEALTVLGNALTRYATLLAPVALVMAVAGLQPIFVFIIGVLLTLLVPHISKERIEKKHMIQKFVCIGCIVVGTIIIGIA